MRNNDLQEQIPSWWSLLLFSIRSKKLLMISGWTVWGADLIGAKCSIMMNKRGAREVAKRKETHQLRPNNIWMDGWVLPKGGKSTIRTRLCTKSQSDFVNFWQTCLGPTWTLSLPTILENSRSLLRSNLWDTSNHLHFHLTWLYSVFL